MAGRTRSTFGKRQKEQKRQEKRLEKAARKEQRKLEKLSGNGLDDTVDDSILSEEPEEPEESGLSSE